METWNLIFTHKAITPPIGYDVIDNTTSDLDHRIWSELAGYKIVYDKIKSMQESSRNGNIQTIPDWISLNHYRRLFPEDCYERIYVPKPMFFGCTLGQQYDYYHSLEDLLICGKALKEVYPTLVNSFEVTLNQTMLIPYTIAILPTNQFMDYFNFLYTVLSKTLEMMNCNNYDDIMKKVKEGNYVKDNKARNNDLTYQCRFISFLSERLATMYWKNVATQIPVYPADITLVEKGQKI